MNDGNIDPKTVASFGDEWERFDQSDMSDEETSKVFDEYFSIFPWKKLPENAEGFDMGCGSGRWSRLAAIRVGHLHCIDPSVAIDVAKVNLSQSDNITFHRGSVDNPGVEKNSQDFGYSLGVLHHIPDTEAAIRSCVNLLKPGAPFLLYIYYAFDNRPLWFKLIWKASDLVRRVVYRLPPALKYLVTTLIAAFVYFPLARVSLLLDRLGLPFDGIPLSYYRKHSFYTLQTDARDRFGTPLEHRFTREEIYTMMIRSGLCNIQFSNAEPYWCAVGIKQ